MTNERHPEELLAGYVDGTLGDRERAHLEAHLATCSRCREESGLAMRAVAELRRLPEEPVPVGVMSPVRDEIGRRTHLRTRRPMAQRVLWAAGGAVAAALIGIVAVSTLSRVGEGVAGGGAEAMQAGASREATGGGATGTAAAPVALERRTTDYDDATLRQLATRMAHEVANGTTHQAPGSAAADSSAQSAATCVTAAVEPDPRDVLVRLISARYRGASALIGIYVTRPGPGRPPDAVDVWVVREDSCSIASYTYKPIR